MEVQSSPPTIRNLSKTSIGDPECLTGRRDVPRETARRTIDARWSGVHPKSRRGGNQSHFRVSRETHLLDSPHPPDRPVTGTRKPAPSSRDGKGKKKDKYRFIPPYPTPCPEKHFSMPTHPGQTKTNAPKSEAEFRVNTAASHRGRTGLERISIDGPAHAKTAPGHPKRLRAKPQTVSPIRRNRRHIAASQMDYPQRAQSGFSL